MMGLQVWRRLTQQIPQDSIRANTVMWATPCAKVGELWIILVGIRLYRVPE